MFKCCVVAEIIYGLLTCIVASYFEREEEKETKNYLFSILLFTDGCLNFICQDSIFCDPIGPVNLLIKCRYLARVPHYIKQQSIKTFKLAKAGFLTSYGFISSE